MVQITIVLLMDSSLLLKCVELLPGCVISLKIVPALLLHALLTLNRLPSAEPVPESVTWLKIATGQIIAVPLTDTNLLHTNAEHPPVIVIQQKIALEVHHPVLMTTRLTILLPCHPILFLLAIREPME
jgi:hypothetical protein